MNITIWIIQGLIAAFFLVPGIRKAFFSKEKLIELKMLEAGAPVAQQRFVGIAELLGVIGIIVPLLTGIVPILTPLAASGLALIMALAFAFHLNRKEYKMLPLLAIVFLLAVVVAFYRFQTL